MAPARAGPRPRRTDLRIPDRVDEPRTVMDRRTPQRTRIAEPIRNRRADPDLLSALMNIRASRAPGELPRAAFRYPWAAAA